MRTITKTVINGKDDNGEPVGFEAPVPEFESITEATEALGDVAALSLLNQQADIKARAKHRDQHKHDGTAASEEQVLAYLKGQGTSTGRSAFGVPASEAGKVKRLVADKVATDDLEGAAKLMADFKADPQGTLTALYEAGTLREGKKRSDD